MQRLVREIEIPEGVSVDVDGMTVTVTGPLGTLKRSFNNPGVVIEKQDNKIIIRTLDHKRKAKANAGTVEAHIRNMLKGVQKEWVYKLRVVYSHFPIKLALKGDVVEILNFLGAKTPRYAKVMPGAKVEIKGQDIIVRSINKEAAGQTAANLELATKLGPEFDPRKFQDGIYIVEKAVWGEE
ncbi:MAG TPA: 50S ribosomal protein L6 [Euryarchaeota archaeon]|nr:50S ribosomal protein L6 [Euryarchaeota archaeon]HIQ09982.1 50S ribosomal protein L6 [Euryarchaeota archaeon]